MMVTGIRDRFQLPLPASEEWELRCQEADGVEGASQEPWIIMSVRLREASEPGADVRTHLLALADEIRAAHARRGLPPTDYVVSEDAIPILRYQDPADGDVDAMSFDRWRALRRPDGSMWELSLTFFVTPDMTAEEAAAIEAAVEASLAEFALLPESP